MRALLLLLAAAWCLNAQRPGIAVYIDLSGPWRASSGDDPRFAARDIDDSAWEAVGVPLGRPRLMSFARGRDPRWYRRTVPLPPEAGNTRLAVVIGSILGNYEVWADGISIGGAGGASANEIEIARPRAFEFWHGNGTHLVVAIRRGDAPIHGTFGWRPDDEGPWLVASPAAVPNQLGLHALTVQKLKRLGDLVQPLILFCLSALILLVWISQPARTELLWLGLYCVLVAGTRMHIFAAISPHSRPFGSAKEMTAILMSLSPAVLLAQLVATTLTVRWLSLAAWVTGSLGIANVLFFFPERVEGFLWPLWCVQLLTIAAMAWSLRRGTQHLVFVAGASAVLYTHASAFGATERLGLPTFTAFSGGGWIAWHYSTHLMVLTVFAFTTTIVLIRRLLRDREDKVRLAGEVEAARTPQQLMLPTAVTGNAEYQIESVYEPAQEVGGDFCFFEQTDGDGILVLLGDVSGKGLRAAMVVSMIAGALRNRRSSQPSALLGELNTVLARDSGGGFVTCICLRLEPRGRVRAANAGHLAPLIDGREPADAEHGLPLGVVSEASWTETEWRMAPGARLTLMSDGVVEASGRDGLFGFERAAEASGRGARDIAEIARTWGQNDDITVVTVRRAAA